MSETKTMIRFFTIADFEEEELWLREQHNRGWKLKNAAVFLYTFERCTPEDVIYRLDYKNSEEAEDYFQLSRDYGWEYFDRNAGWLYFRKPAAALASEAEGEIFSDGLSKLDMVKQVVVTRLLPLLVIFLCCLLPSWLRLFDEGIFNAVSYVLYALVLLYIWLLVYCGIKLTKLRKKYEEQ
mgnify:CR=1 FL=1